MLKVNHILLVPSILLTLPPAALFQQPILFLAILTIVGLTGMLLRKTVLASIASASLLFLIVWGKIASDIYSLPAPDSALLLIQFMLVIFLMEASNVVLILDSSQILLEGRTDEFSETARVRSLEWARVQFARLGRLTIASSTLALLLLVVGGVVSVPASHIAFSGILVLAAVAAIVILLTYRREPEEHRIRKR